jgi:adenylyltransferase/sulfurtransferase
MALKKKEGREISRYHRQYLVPQIGERGQEKICEARVAVLGCGALGSNIASHLARSGCGFIRVVDRDFIELNNLQRQVLFDEEDIREGIPKAVAARKKMGKINSEIEVEAVVEDVNFTNIEDFVRDVDMVLDGMDNFETRFLINDACVKQGIPWIYGGCIGTHGLTMVIVPGHTPCLRCIFESAPPPELSPTCDTAGVLGPAVSVVAALQAMEAVKFLSGNSTALDKTLYTYDVWTREARALKVKGLNEKVNCPTCRERKFEYLTGEKGSRTTSLCGRNAVQIARGEPLRLDLAALAEKLGKVGEVKYNAFLLRFRVEGHEITLFPDGRAIIQGTNDIAQAKTLYAKYVSL